MKEKEGSMRSNTKPIDIYKNLAKSIKSLQDYLENIRLQSTAKAIEDAPVLTSMWQSVRGISQTEVVAKLMVELRNEYQKFIIQFNAYQGIKDDPTLTDVERNTIKTGITNCIAATDTAIGVITSSQYVLNSKQFVEAVPPNPKKAEAESKNEKKFTPLSIIKASLESSFELIKGYEPPQLS
jgi:hypothetical protein